MLVTLMLLVAPAAAGPWMPASCPESADLLEQRRTEVRAECKASDARTGQCMADRGWTRKKSAEAQDFLEQCQADRQVALAAADAYLDTNIAR